ncbi:zinc-binding protein A33-like [Carcharodon carcharias]|uniref:zinc-binding protein A33-like n=1 Tax=Carcharodon carcharias TaxID=13397 RepID=UPI001B7E9D85|nr:zinc-binding protein A33-like [Carcharodon carcharias]
MDSGQQPRSWTQEVNCSICLDFFADPVSLECGHNLCRSCITRCCAQAERDSCPECREEFPDRKLTVNRNLARLAEKARKLKVNPGGNGNKLHCEEHEEELKLFCETDKKLICLICRDSREHKSHNFMPIKEAVEIYKDQLKSSLQSLTEKKSMFLETELKQTWKISEKIMCQKRRTSENYDKQPLAEGKLSIGKFNSPLQYMAWREMIDAISPAPASLTLDPETANPWLMVSEDRTSVRLRDKPQELPDTPERFDCCVSALGSEGFTSERHYWEVEVQNKTCWSLELARQSANRKGQIDPRPQAGYWTVCLLPGRGYVAGSSHSDTPLAPGIGPQKIGVFLDYEARQVSFYNADSMSHPHTYNHTFTETLLAFFFPGPNDGGKNRTPLSICGFKGH